MGMSVGLMSKNLCAVGEVEETFWGILSKSQAFQAFFLPRFQANAWEMPEKNAWISGKMPEKTKMAKIPQLLEIGKQSCQKLTIHGF